MPRPGRLHEGVRAAARVERLTIRPLFEPAFAAVRDGLKPFVLIQSCAVAAVVAFYFVPWFQNGAELAQRVKEAGGLPFAALSTAFAGVVLPEAARWLTLRTRTPVVKLGFQAAVFAVIGISVDLLYRGLADLFGSQPSPIIVVKKVLFDQFVYSPSFSILLSTLAFLWEVQGFSFRRTRNALSHGGFLRAYLPLLVTCWCFWIPVNAATYSLPSKVQFILFLFAQGAWSLLLVHIAGERSAKRAGALQQA